jgi:hypothetical protein
VRFNRHAVKSLALILSASFTPVPVATGQQRPTDRPVLGEWLGCWAIEMRDSTPHLARMLVVRLDDTPAPTRGGGPQNYYGRGYDGFPRDGQWPFPLVWASWSLDSIDVSVISLGGTGWRLKRSGDSLLGGSYEFYDIIPDETPLGWARARRRACP